MLKDVGRPELGSHVDELLPGAGWPGELATAVQSRMAGANEAREMVWGMRP
jgi:hypothetical protein